VALDERTYPQSIHAVETDSRPFVRLQAESVPPALMLTTETPAVTVLAVMTSRCPEVIGWVSVTAQVVEFPHPELSGCWIKAKVVCPNAEQARKARSQSKRSLMV
jgi:hypothetical protein